MQDKCKVPRVMISAVGSGSGKTTLMIALLSAFRIKNIRVQSFKSGPDYIDAMFHERVTGQPVYHTDPFFSDEEQLKKILSVCSAGADIAVIEGAMGYYDGIGTGTDCSAYTVASRTDTPVILVIDPKGMSASVGAICKGFAGYRENSNIKGIVLNRIRPAMYEHYRTVIEKNTGIHVYGFLPELDGVTLKSRHLGLVTADEIDNFDMICETLGSTAVKTLDIEGIIQLASEAPELPYFLPPEKKKSEVRIGVAKDRAFCFYYEENLKMLKNAGAEIVLFSPLKDKSLPENLDGLYFGGGYPELYAGKLSCNHSFIESLRQAVRNGMPVYAECGGFMYLLDSIEDREGKKYPMAGILSGNSFMKNHLVRFGYITLTAEWDTLLAEKGDVLYGHEFHYSDTTDNGSSFLVRRPNGRTWKSFQSNGNVLGGFPHLYFPSCPKAVEKIIKAMKEYHRMEN